MSQTYQDLTFTNFPESVDTFKTMLDIAASDASALSAYQAAMETGNITQASAALANIPNVDKKLISAADVNKLTNAVIALQRFYSTNIQTYISNLQSQWQTEINKFSYIGNYSSTTAYKKNNIVSYTSGAYKYLYICIKDAVAGISPTNTTYWQPFTIKGIQGISGTNLSFLYEWDNTTSYVTQDCVTCDGFLWVCVINNSNSKPSVTNTNWKEIMSLHSSIYPVQSTQPTSQVVGELWFEVVS